MNVQDARFGARCDWTPGHGTDDTQAFIRAARAASESYRRNGRVTELRIGKACRVDSTVTFGSGIAWVGPGAIIVPEQVGPVLLAEDADDVEVRGITVDVEKQSCGVNNASCPGIAWRASATDQTQHHHVVFRDNTVQHTNWGVLVAYAKGKGSLVDVEVRDNIVRSANSYEDADGIHIGGRVSRFAITGNQISNRGDAGVAASSELPDYICSGGVIEDNVLLEDQVGLDNSGCTNTVWRGNFVYATRAPRGSNPAFRSIDYLGLTPDHVSVTGNYFRSNPALAEYAAKVDDGASTSATHAVLAQNVFDSTLALYVRGTGVQVRANVFPVAGTKLTLDYNGPHAVKTSDVTIGTNQWRGPGLINIGENKALLTQLVLAPQLSPKEIKATHLEMFTHESGPLWRPPTALVVRPVMWQKADATTMHAGDCVALRQHVAGLTTASNVGMSSHREDGATVPSPLVVWGYAEGADELVVKVCALREASFDPASLRVEVEGKEQRH